MLSPLNEASK